jgi:hypothetical protein
MQVVKSSYNKALLSTLRCWERLFGALRPQVRSKALCFVAMNNVLMTLIMLSSTPGCVRSVTWDGYQPAYDYRVTFVDTAGKPVEGVTFVCKATEGTFGGYQAQELNRSATSSDKNGLIILSHGDFEVGGSYKELGQLQWDINNPNSAFCEFLYRGKVFHAAPIERFNKPQTVVVNSNATSQSN